MRLIFWSDPHNSDAPPRMRRDSYMKDILDKQAFLIEPSKGVDLVICGGDVFHQKKSERVSYRLMNQILEIYREFPRLLIVPGNHDINGRMEWGDRPLGILAKLPNVKVVHNAVEVFDDIRIFCWGGGEFYSRDVMVESLSKVKSFPTIVVVHAAVTAHAVREYPFEVIPFKYVTKYGHLFLVGHLHDYQTCLERIVAPGALSRGVLREDDKLNRKIYYALLEMDGNLIWKTRELIEVPSRPVEEVFKVETKREEKAKETEVSSFMEVVESLGVPKTLNKEGLLLHIESLDLPPGVKKKAVEILGRL